MGTQWFYNLGLQSLPGFSPIFSGSQKIYRANLEEDLENFLMVPGHVQYLASDVVNALICDRHLSAAQTLFELADQSFFPL